MLTVLAEKIKDEGKREGVREDQIAVAKRMLKDKRQLEMIMKYTRLSLSEIKKIQRSLK